MKYLILGNGWLGNLLKEYLGEDARLYGEKMTPYDFDHHIFNEYDVLINAIAKTNIDWCELNKVEALQTNALLPYILSKVVNFNDKKYVFLSSACIFESKNIDDIKYEDSIPNPACFYARTKQMAEDLIQEVNQNSLTIRLRLPISEKSHPRNTLDKLLKYDKINTNQESVTVIEDMLPVLKELIEKDEKGIFHLVNEGTISPSELADLMGHSYKEVTKEEQDERLHNEGRAKRVTAYIGSKRIPLLPNIKERAPEIIKKWKQTL